MARRAKPAPDTGATLARLLMPSLEASPRTRREAGMGGTGGAPAPAVPRPTLPRLPVPVFVLVLGVLPDAADAANVVVPARARVLGVDTTRRGCRARQEVFLVSDGRERGMGAARREEREGCFLREVPARGPARVCVGAGVCAAEPVSGRERA